MTRASVLLAVLAAVASPRAARAGGSVAGRVLAAGGVRADEIVVYVERVEGRFPRPGDRPRVWQKGKQFLPRVLPVLVGSTVEFPNADLVFHNVFSLSPGNEFDLGLYRQGGSRSKTFERPGVVEVFCNVHSSMVAWVLVLQNPFFARLDKDGGYRIEGLPAGGHRAVAWWPGGSATLSVEVRAGRTATADFAVGGP